MPRLLESVPSTRLLIVGDGPSRPQLEATAHRLGIAAFAHFTGYLRDVASAYAAMDVFVLPSRYEGMPMALIETMAMGIPVVGTRVQGIADLIEDETTGLLVPHGDPQALASAVLRLLSDAALRERIRWNARSVVRRDHTRERMAARFEALYAELCAERAD
jgi:glycosyltransferase involved in cell wall biosynthesis